MGFTKSNITHPIKKDAIANIRKIFKFEKPKTFNVNKSRLFLILIMNHILERKMINGKILIIKLGIKILVSISGINILTSIFLKNTISSNKFNITPKQ